MMTVTRGGTSRSPTAPTRADVAPVAASNWLKPDEPTMTSSIIEVVVIADIREDLSAAQLSRRKHAARTRVATTPIAADSDGVAIPKKMKPVTTSTSPSSGETSRSPSSFAPRGTGGAT